MKRWAWLTILALIVSLAAPALAEGAYYGTMMVDNCEEWVSLREDPDTGSVRLAKVPLFAIVTDAQWDSDWGDFIHCDYDGQTGYILSRYLVPWADPEPEGIAGYDGGLGFTFDYDPEALQADGDMSEDGQSLVLYPTDTDAPVYLELLTAQSAGGSSEAFLEMNVPAEVPYEFDGTDGGDALILARVQEDDITRTYYAVDGADGFVAGVATYPADEAKAWEAQFDAVMRSVAFPRTASVYVDWAADARAAVVADPDGELVAIMADEPVYDLVLLELTLAEGDGETTFEAQTLYIQDELLPGEALVAQLAFPGDVPGYGLRFTDADGATRQYAIGLSGRDGSLVLEAY